MESTRLVDWLFLAKNKPSVFQQRGAGSRIKSQFFLMDQEIKLVEHTKFFSGKNCWLLLLNGKKIYETDKEPEAEKILLAFRKKLVQQKQISHDS